ncbi:hypothetical protein PAPYR_12223 [Paratrimastix pyriformis]|uniref:Uncharacterized protein n=1 Tax=Paratrimastix pyriformis TaxID=342808 RepID=A0ABQ8U4J9_9EUKA|nr:hypothetical protein PAPYR_12223 [Paratrimastix pyriformis]
MSSLRGLPPVPPFPIPGVPERIHHMDLVRLGLGVLPRDDPGRPRDCNIADFLSRAFPTTPHLTTLPAAPEPTQPTLRCCAISTPTVPVHPTLPDDFVEANTLRPLLDQLPYDIDDNGIIHLHDTPPPDLLSPLFALAHSHPLPATVGEEEPTFDSG